MKKPEKICNLCEGRNENPKLLIKRNGLYICNQCIQDTKEVMGLPDIKEGYIRPDDKIVTKISTDPTVFSITTKVPDTPPEKTYA